MFVGECLGAADGDTGASIVPLAGDVDGQINQPPVTLAARLEARGSNASSIARLDALLRDISAERLFLKKAHALLNDSPPALDITGAELAGIDEVSLCAI